MVCPRSERCSGKCPWW